MARRPQPLASGTGPRRAARLVLATSVLGLALATSPIAAGAQDAPAAVPTLAQVLRGEVEGLSAEATTVSALEMGVEVVFTNDGDGPAEVAIPFGTLLVTEDEADQTLAVMPPPTDEVVEVAARGGTPTIELATGTSTHQLDAYCTEMDDGYPSEDTAVMPIDDAHPALADTLRAATAQDADPGATQDAVWWLTDQPAVPVADHISGLLEVDTAAFAADPHRVTPNTGYIPLWMREEIPPGDGGSMTSPSPYDEEEAAGIVDESFEGPASPTGSAGDGAATGALVWAVLVGLVVVTAVIVATRAGRRPALAPALASTGPGWYPDPWTAGGHRYWDGRGWTARVMGPR